MIYIASDHQGFKAKEQVRGFLKTSGYEVEDMGAYEYDKDDDYPDYAFPLAEKVVDENALGIVFCGSGVGVCVAANKVIGARAALIEDKTQAIHGRERDNMNILVLDGGTFDPSKDFGIVEGWLNAEFQNLERDLRRLKKIEEYESK